VFDGDLTIDERKILQERHLKYTLIPRDGGESVEAIVFNVDPREWPDAGEVLNIAYTLDINRFRGAESLQLMIRSRITANEEESPSGTHREHHHAD
jgi:single-stranded-DNA-specific exonuclease